MSGSPSLRAAGIDIGSRSIELVVLNEGTVVSALTAPAGHDPLATATALLADARFDRLIATGYGRHLLELACEAETVTEIKAYALGARHACPTCRTVLDIGGQDVKAIALTSEGRVRNFEMNDRCAAGSGKFLEMMATTLGYLLADFGAAALQATGTVTVSSMCAVFAESEVTSLLHRKAAREEIALAVHQAVVKRALGMLRRVTVTEPLLFAGGGALNPCLVRLLQQAVGVELRVPDNPQMLGALGAALIAAER